MFLHKTFNFTDQTLRYLKHVLCIVSDCCIQYEVSSLLQYILVHTYTVRGCLSIRMWGWIFILKDARYLLKNKKY